MFALQSPARLSAAALFSLVLTACGGGGGGGGGDDNPGNTGNPGNGNQVLNPALVAIDLGNGKQLTFAARAIASVAQSAVASGPASVGKTMATVASRGTIDETFDCDSGGTMKVKGSASSTTLTGDVVFTYINCINGGAGYNYHERLNGNIRIVQRAGSTSGIASAYDYHYDNYQYDDLQSGHGFRYAGSFSVDPDGIGNRFSGTFSVTDLHDQHTFSANGYVANYVQMAQFPFSPLYVAVQRSGRIGDSTWGAVDVAVDASDYKRSYLNGLNQSRLRIDEPANVDSLHLALDANGDGKYERFAWVADDSLYGIINPNTTPTVAVNVVQPAEGIGQFINVPLSGIADEQFDFLNYSVVMIQAPGGTAAPVLNEDGAFSFTANARGTYRFLLTVDDGRGGTSTQILSFDIKLTAPSVQAPAAIVTNTNGAPIATSVQPINSDAGPFNYRIVSGPAGMTVDNQGNVQWQPTTAFFDRIEVQAIVSVGNADHEIEVPLTLQVSDTDRAKPLVRSVIDGPQSSGNTFVLDFAHDGVNRIVTTDNNQLIYSLKLQGGNYVQDWVFPYAVSDSTVDHILPFDVDNDGIYEIAVKSAGSIYIIGEDHETIDRSIALDAYGPSKLFVADIDNDGHDELITMAMAGNVNSLQGVVLDAATLTEKWRTPPLELGFDFAIGNIDGDAALELVFVGGTVFDGQTHGLQWWLGGPFGHIGVAVGDVDGDGIAEIVGFTNSFSGTGIQAYSAISQSGIWSIPAENLGLGDVTLAQLDGDPALEIVAGDRFHGNVKAYDATSSSATLKWSVAESSGVTDFAIGDANNDGTTDLLWGLQNWSGVTPSITVFDLLNSTRVFSTTVEPLKGGFRGGIPVVENGTQQIMFSSLGAVVSLNHTSSHFATIDRTTGAIVRSNATDSHGAEAPSFCTYDYDSDGSDDLLFGASDGSNYYLESYNFATQAQQWRLTSPTSFWSNFPRACGDFNGDGNLDVAWLVSGTLEIYDATLQISQWSVSQTANQLAAGDLDGDGRSELLATDLTQIRKFRFDGNNYVADGTFTNIPVPARFEDRAQVSLVDIDGDHKPEIIVTYATYNQFIGTALIVLNADMTERSRSVVEGKIVAIAPDSFQQGHVLATVKSAAYPSQQRAALIDVNTGAWVWRSPLLIGELSSDGLHYDASAPDGGSLSIGTGSAMYITR